MISLDVEAARAYWAAWWATDHSDQPAADSPDIENAINRHEGMQLERAEASPRDMDRRADCEADQREAQWTS